MTLSDYGLTGDLPALLPVDGLKLALWEIGGTRGGHLRQVPRGSHIDGLMICYSVLDRASFQNVAHLLMQHRTDRHLDLHAPSLVKGGPARPRLPVVICGTKVDEADADGRRAVSEEEAQAFARASGVAHALTTSAKTGEFVQEAFHALAAAILEAEEEAEAEGLAAGPGPGSGAAAEAWSLRRPVPAHALAPPADGGGALTCPRGARPHEPHHTQAAPRLVEVVDHQGVAYGARPLDACLERGLLHRAVHVWLVDLRTGGLLLRKYGRTSKKMQRRWGPTCHGEVLCYGSTADESTGPHTAELSLTAAGRVAREQLSLQLDAVELEHWFSCRSQSGTCRELVDVFVAPLRDRAGPAVRFARDDEEAEWVHYLDVFGPEVVDLPSIFHVEDEYRDSMVRRMCSRIVHAASERPTVHAAALLEGRPACPLSVG